MFNNFYGFSVKSCLKLLLIRVLSRISVFLHELGVTTRFPKYGMFCNTVSPEIYSNTCQKILVENENLIEYKCTFCKSVFIQQDDLKYHLHQNQCKILPIHLKKLQENSEKTS